MAVVVIGGHSRNVGKTSVVEGVIRAMSWMRWTAMKITAHAHAVSERDTEKMVTEEFDRASSTDSSRYLAAGAVRSLWVRAPELEEAMPRIREEIARAENVVIESNSVLRFLKPDVYLSVLDPSVEDFKDSARLYLDRADAVLVPEGVLERSAWKGVSLKLLEGTPVLPMRPPVYVTDEVMVFLLKRLGARTVGSSR